MSEEVIGSRSFTHRRRIYLGDGTGGGRLRLDALVRYLQDVATDDAEEGRSRNDIGWVLRRMNLEIGRLPALYEDIELTTWCSGVGGRWAERSTALSDTREVFGGVCVTARAVWVYISLDTGASLPLAPEFFALYGEDVRKHKVSARLTHPGPPPDALRQPWPLRRVDFDVFGHVNNAVYWAAIEDVLDEWRAGRRIRAAEIEFRSGIDPGEEAEIVIDAGDVLSVWFLVDGDVRASAQVHLR